MSYETATIEPSRRATVRGLPSKAAVLRKLPVGLAVPLHREAVRAVMSTYDTDGPLAAMRHAKTIKEAFITYDGIERSIA